MNTPRRSIFTDTLCGSFPGGCAQNQSVKEDTLSKENWRKIAPVPQAERRDTLSNMLVFFCPIETAVHQDVDILEQRARRWLADCDYFGNPGNRSRVIGTRSAEFYARMTPNAQTDRLQVAVEWTYWGFAFDDAYCDTEPWSRRPAEFAERAGRINRLLEAPAYVLTVRDPYLDKLAELRDRFAAISTPVQHRRWVLAQRAWLSGVVWQVGNHSRDIMPPLEDYLSMRLNSAAGETVTSMIEVVNGPEVPAGEMESLGVRACTEMARMLASLDNDLLSYVKDVDRDEADQNIVNVLIGEYGVTVREAMTRGISIRDRIMCRFLRLRERIPSRLSAATRHYLEDLGHVVRGNIDWAIRTPRYHTDNPAPALRFACGDKPSDDSNTPPAASIAWWWDTDLIGH